MKRKYKRRLNGNRHGVELWGKVTLVKRKKKGIKREKNGWSHKTKEKRTKKVRGEEWKSWIVSWTGFVILFMREGLGNGAERRLFKMNHGIKLRNLYHLWTKQYFDVWEGRGWEQALSVTDCSYRLWVCVGDTTITMAREPVKKPKDALGEENREEMKYRRREKDGWFHGNWILWWNHDKKVWQEGREACVGYRVGREGREGDRGVCVG